MAKLHRHRYISRQVGGLYISFALILLPWTLYVAISLPIRAVTDSWDVMWAGIDVAIVVSLLLTGLYAYRRSLYTAIFATLAGSFIVIDAWIDIMSAQQHHDILQAIVLAVFIELPVACYSFYLAHSIVKRADR